MLLAFGIIYKAWLLCGALSPCLLPLLPMTLPGLQPPSAPSAALPAREAEFGALSNRFTATGFQKESPSFSFTRPGLRFAPPEK